MDINTLTTMDLTTIIYSACIGEDVSDLVSEINTRAAEGDHLAQNFMARRSA